MVKQVVNKRINVLKTKEHGCTMQPNRKRARMEEFSQVETKSSLIEKSTSGLLGKSVQKHGVKKREDKCVRKEGCKERFSRPDIWFDGVSHCLVKASASDQSAVTRNLVKTTAFTGPTRRVALDCEFVGVGFQGHDDSLARVSLVNQFGHTLLDLFVRQKETVTDYRTPVSGIRRENLLPSAGAVSFEEATQRLADLLKGRIVIGHSLINDFKVLMLSHPRNDIRDTARFSGFRALFDGRTPSLKALTERVLEVKVQDGEHDSVQDARAAMRLYQSVKHIWEAGITAGRQFRHPKQKQKKKKKAAGVPGSIKSPDKHHPGNRNGDSEANDDANDKDRVVAEKHRHGMTRGEVRRAVVQMLPRLDLTTAKGNGQGSSSLAAWKLGAGHLDVADEYQSGLSSAFESVSAKRRRLATAPPSIANGSAGASQALLMAAAGWDVARNRKCSQRRSKFLVKQKRKRIKRSADKQLLSSAL